MKKEKLGQEPAFPTDYVDSKNGGMSKRYVTAKDILCAILSNPEIAKAFANEERCVNGISKEELVIKGCYDWADLLLKQENE